VKGVDAKIGNDPIYDMAHFDETSRWMEWSKNEFSHRLAPEPTAVGAVSSAVPLGFTSARQARFTQRVGGGSAAFFVRHHYAP
jgi:hypothetical protein